MKTIVIKSNHGNHEGFNRKWQILNGGYSFETIDEAQAYLASIADDEDPIFNSETEDFEPRISLSSWHEDLHYYYVVTEEDYNTGFFDGGSRGYATEAIKSIFENE